ncbi:MAG TPA: rhodanese-like domain-containing protein, partial [Campylobacterales bacterium]|nr:rhodanese-like domain-containing protein [Campylobacterales bacterium]
MKINSNLFYWALIAGLLGFILYQKGLILTDFEKVDAQTAYTFLSDNNTTILDVRTIEELKTDGMIEGALHIPLQALNKNIGKLRP